MNVIWTKQKLHERLSKETLTRNAQASGDGCSPERCCRLCGEENNLRHFYDTYVWEGVETRYDQLLFSCFGIRVFPSDCMICEWCIKQLRKTEQFRALVHAAFEQTSSKGSSDHSIKTRDTIQKIDVKAATSVYSQKKTQLLKTKTPAEETCRKRATQRRREAKEMVTYKRANITCTMCNQRYPMMVPVGGEETFVCSRCKKNGERSAVCKKCNIVMPMSEIRDHMSLHVKADLRGKSRLRAQQYKPSQDQTEGAAKGQFASKHRLAQGPKKFNEERCQLKHLRNNGVGTTLYRNRRTKNCKKYNSRLDKYE